VQTYYPEDPAITAASRHDYLAFFEAELPLRRELRYPPFGRLARIVLAGTHLQTVRSEIEKVARVIHKRNGNNDVIVLGLRRRFSKK